MFEFFSNTFVSTTIVVNMALTGAAPTTPEPQLSSDNISTIMAEPSSDTQSIQVVEVKPPTEETGFTSIAPPPPPPPVVKAPTPATKSVPSQKTVNAAPAVTPNPGSAQEMAWIQVQAKGWGQSEFNCLVSLWKKESGWRVNAANPSGAYGIPQALPGSKMSSAGADWATNPDTQIRWGLGYIQDRYATPCGAWNKSQSSGWY
jgi:hypothetical protein